MIALAFSYILLPSFTFTGFVSDRVMYEEFEFESSFKNLEKALNL